MGLTVFKGKHPVKSEVTVAKNYMTEKELFALRRMVNAFFDEPCCATQGFHV